MAYKPGRRVRTRLMNPSGHTRLPTYLRGREGRIERILGSFPFADTRATGADAAEEILYTVRFSASDLWGADAPEATSICADLFHSYLEAAE